MTKTANNAANDYELMTRVANMYYVDDMTHEKIAKTIGLSRIKVGRLLKKAREVGIVEISVRPHPGFNYKLEQQLIQRFSLKQALVAINHPDPKDQRAAVARLVADYLANNLRDGMIVAVGMGRNCGAVPESLLRPQPRSCVFISAMGGSPKAKAPYNPDDICRRFAERFDGTSESLYSPAYVKNKHIRDLLVHQEDVGAILERTRKADMAIVGIGDINLDSNLVKLGCVSPLEMAQLSVSGAVGDVLGCTFDINGIGSRNGLIDRVVGLNIEDLRKIPCVIAVSSESNKTLSILGALRLGVIDIIATSEHNAKAVIELDQQNPKNN